MIARVLATEAAIKIIEQLQQAFGGLMFHQSGGCCDGSAPICFREGEFKLGETDVLMGSIAGCNFYMAQEQFDYWKHTQLIIDISRGRGSGFSLEIPLGVRFITRSRLFTEEEWKELQAAGVS